jgi:hypothetical protein
MADVPLTLGSRTIPVSQLPASNSNSTQSLNRRSPLTHSLINQLAPLNSPELNLVSRMIQPQNGPHRNRKHRFQHYFQCCTGFCLAMAIVLLFGSQSLSSNGTICNIAPSLRLFGTVMSSFPRTVLVTSDQPPLPSPRLSSHDDYSQLLPLLTP